VATYEVSVSSHFDAAHYLRNYKGKCEKLHGHRFQVAVSVRAKELNEIGISFDFTELKRHLNEVLENFDHVCLNDIPPYDKINPTTENIALAIYEGLKSRIGEFLISRVQVWESPDSSVTYIP
jgi:6-pyruvoyltetrahydropterin/6-carboxytetrahydropterin synthase